jgi:hypothetical protein
MALHASATFTTTSAYACAASKNTMLALHALAALLHARMLASSACKSLRCMVWSCKLRLPTAAMCTAVLQCIKPKCLYLLCNNTAADQGSYRCNTAALTLLLLLPQECIVQMADLTKHCSRVARAHVQQCAASHDSNAAALVLSNGAPAAAIGIQQCEAACLCCIQRDKCVLLFSPCPCGSCGQLKAKHASCAWCL